MARSFLAVVAIALALGYLAPAQAVVPTLKQPVWQELTADQRKVLAPLSGEWDRLESWRRQKWLGIAQRYPALGAEEQARVQRRMVDWVKLSPDERKIAREKYKSLQKAPQEHKEVFKQKWNEYKQLPEEEKQRLKEAAAKAKPLPKPGGMVAPNPALVAPPPVAPPPAVDTPPITAQPTAAAPQ